MAPAVGMEADTQHNRRPITTSTANNGTTTHLATRTRLAFLVIFCYCQWVLLTTAAPYFSPGAKNTDAIFFRATSGGGGVLPGAGMGEWGGNSSVQSTGGGSGSGGGGDDGGGGDGGRGGSGVFNEEPGSRRPPRILTVLTTYGKRSSFVKPYKEVMSARNDSYRPTVSVSVIALLLFCSHLKFAFLGIRPGASVCPPHPQHGPV